MKFKNDIELQAGLEDLSGSTGTSGQLLSSTGTGTSWIAQDDIISAASKLVVIACKNTHSATISKGTPVYQTGTVGATDVIEIAPADALISLGHQPAVGLLQQDLAINEFGNVVITGELLNFTTDPIDGLTPVTGQKVFLKSGGGLTLTKPTGVTNGIQNLGLIGKVSGGNSGSITVSSIMRTNDVPNLTTGKIWVGDGNTVESTVVHLDEANGRMGIGTASPVGKLNVALPADSTGNVASWSSNQVVFTRGGTSTSQGLGFSVHDVNNTATISSLTPAVTWSDLNYRARNHAFYSNGATLGIYQNISGNVGIGTTSPSQKLEVDGAIKVTNTFTGETSANSGYFDFSSVTSTARITTKGSDGSTLGKFQILQQASDGSPNNTPFYIDSDSNVGIGTTSPSEKLDVVGNIELNGVLYIGSRGIYQQENTDVSGLELVANASISLYRAAFFDFVIKKEGNVRAGTVFACHDGGTVEYTETSTNDYR